MRVAYFPFHTLFFGLIQALGYALLRCGAYLLARDGQRRIMQIISLICKAQKLGIHIIRNSENMLFSVLLYYHISVREDCTAHIKL